MASIPISSPKDSVTPFLKTSRWPLCHFSLLHFCIILPQSFRNNTPVDCVRALLFLLFKIFLFPREDPGTFQSLNAVQEDHSFGEESVLRRDVCSVSRKSHHGMISHIPRAIIDWWHSNVSPLVSINHEPAARKLDVSGHIVYGSTDLGELWDIENISGLTGFSRRRRLAGARGGTTWSLINTWVLPPRWSLFPPRPTWLGTCHR